VSALSPPRLPYFLASMLCKVVLIYNSSSLLFAGLLMNYDRVPKGLKWTQTLSFFHAAYEALLVNELRYLQLIEHKVCEFPCFLLIRADACNNSLDWIFKSPVRPVSFWFHSPFHEADLTK